MVPAPVGRGVWLSQAAVAQVGPAARLVGDVVFEVALAGGPVARPGWLGGVPDLSQVPRPSPWVVAPGLEPVVAVLGAQGVELNDQVRPGSGVRSRQVPYPPGFHRPALAQSGPIWPWPWRHSLTSSSIKNRYSRRPSSGTQTSMTSQAKSIYDRRVRWSLVPDPTPPYPSLHG